MTSLPPGDFFFGIVRDSRTEYTQTRTVDAYREQSTRAWRGDVDGLVADEVSIIPGVEELSNPLCIDDHRASRASDVLVVDAAPTGETLRLLSPPDALHWWIEQIFPMYRRGMKVARPLVRALTDAPMPPDKVSGVCWIYSADWINCTTSR
jgi:anion-transporting  ArsA/GET3 family ATPase